VEITLVEIEQQCVSANISHLTGSSQSLGTITTKPSPLISLAGSLLTHLVGAAPLLALLAYPISDSNAIGDDVHSPRFQDFCGTVIVFVALFMPLLVYGLIVRPMRLVRLRSMATVLGIHGTNFWSEGYSFSLFICNFALFLGWYSFQFHSEGTWRPAWTEKLG
jgi:hypothetical protein